MPDVTWTQARDGSEQWLRAVALDVRAKRWQTLILT